jgi:hypothetical protein
MIGGERSAQTLSAFIANSITFPPMHTRISVAVMQQRTQTSGTIEEQT